MSKIIENKPVSQNFLPEPIKEDHYVMGSGQLGLEVLMPDGHGWGKWLPLGESQLKNGVDPQSCPSGGSLNCVEAIGRKKYGASFQNDLSERYLSIMSGMTGAGGYPHAVSEIMRNYAGAVPEVFLPFDTTITTLKKYFNPRPMSYALFKIGAHWRIKYDFKHEWVFVDGTLESKRNKMKQALKSSPLGVAGYAWSLHDDGKYYSDGPPIHWYQVFDYVEGDHWLAFDTYADHSGTYVKKLSWDYDFAYCKRYSLNRRVGGEEDDKPKSAIIPYCLYIIKYYLGL